jgi:hypothetical protein
MPAKGFVGQKMSQRPEELLRRGALIAGSIQGGSESAQKSSFRFVQVHAAGFIRTELESTRTWTDRAGRDRMPSVSATTSVPPARTTAVDSLRPAEQPTLPRRTGAVVASFGGRLSS